MLVGSITVQGSTTCPSIRCSLETPPETTGETKATEPPVIPGGSDTAPHGDRRYAAKRVGQGRAVTTHPDVVNPGDRHDASKSAADEVIRPLHFRSDLLRFHLINSTRQACDFETIPGLHGPRKTRWKTRQRAP